MADTSTQRKYRWRDEKFYARVGNDIINKVNAYQENYNALASDYQKRYSGRKYTYEDAYVSDSAEWKDSVAQRRQSLDAEVNGINAYIDRFADGLNEDWVKQIKSSLAGTKDNQGKMAAAAVKDNEWWSNFGSEELVNQYGSAEEAYKYYQRSDGYSKKYTGMTSDEIGNILAGMDDGEEKEWLTSYASAVDYDEKSKLDLSAAENDIAAMESELQYMSQYWAEAQDALYYYEGDREEYEKQATKLFGQYGGSAKAMEKIFKEKQKELEEKKQYVADAKRVQEHKQEAEKWNGYTKASDFDLYASKGAAIENPSYSDAFGIFIGPWQVGEEDIGNIVTFSRDNYTQVASNSSVVGNAIYNNMTEDEVKLYNYLLAKEGREVANSYLSHLEPMLKDAEGKRMADKITNIDIPVIEDLVVVGTGFSAGLENWHKSAESFFTGEEISPSILQIQNAYIGESLDGKFGQYAHQAATTIGNMAPSILVSAALGLAGAPTALAQGLGAATMGVSAAGGAYSDALAKGYDKASARTYSTLVGISEGTLQYLIGGIGNLGGVSGKISAGTAKLAGKVAAIDSSLLRVAAFGLKGLNLGLNIGSEIIEEELQNYLEPVFRSIIFGEDYDAPTMDELIETAIVTALSTGVLEGGRIRREVNNEIALNRDAVNKYGGKAEALVQEGLGLEANSKANLLAQEYQKKTESGKNLTGYEIRQLLAANQEQITANDLKKIQKAAEKRLTELGQTEDVERLAELATKYVTGQKMSKAEKAFLANSKNGNRVAQEALPDNILSGDYTSGWTEGIGTKQVNSFAYNIKNILEQIANMDNPAVYKSLEERTGTETTYKVSKNGQAAIRGTNEAIDLSRVEVTEFVKDKNGKIVDMVIAADGKKVKASEVDYSDDSQSYLYDAVSKIENITPADATAIIRDYDPASGQTVSEYLNGVDEAYTYGYYGYSEADLKAGDFAPKLTDVQAKSAYVLGQNAKAASKTAKADAIKRMRTAAQARSIDTEGKETYDNDTAANAIAPIYENRQSDQGLSEDGGIQNGAKQEHQGTKAVHGGREAGSQEMASGTQTETGNRSGIPEEVGTRHEDPASGRQHRGLETGRNFFAEEDFVNPPKDSALHDTVKAFQDGYGIECHIVKASSWTWKNPAHTHNGVIYICESIDADTLATVVPHETAHVMKQRGFQPYLDFIEKTPDFLNMQATNWVKLMETVANHRGLGNVDLSDSQLVNLYDELNAIVYGLKKGGILDNSSFEFGDWMPDAFYDFEGYIRELDAIYEQYRKQSGTAKTAAEAERVKAEDKEVPKAKNLTVTYDGGNGDVVEIDKAGIQDAKRSAGIKVAKILHKMGLGTRVEFFSSYLSKTMKDEKGNAVRVFLDENGVEQRAYSGVYRKGDGMIRVDLNAYNGKGLTLNALSHEMTHFIQQWSAEKYQVLADFLVKSYESTDMTMHERVLREQARLERIRKEEVSYDEAFDEVVANAMSKMLDDGKVIERLNELKAQDMDLAQKLWEGLKKLLNKFFRIYESESALFHDSADLMELKVEFEQMQKMWAEALVEASENYQAAVTTSEVGNKSGEQLSSQETDIDTDADSAYDSAKKETKQEDKADVTREETRESFNRRAHEKKYTVRERGQIACGYTSVANKTRGAGQTERNLKKLGIQVIVHEGLEANVNGITRVILGDATSVAGDAVYVRNSMKTDPIETAGHEAFHFWKHTDARIEYKETVAENIVFSSDAFIQFQKKIADVYFGEEIGIEDDDADKLSEEIFAYITGLIHAGDSEESVRPFLRDYDAVKAAWDDLIKKQATRKDQKYSSQETDLDSKAHPYAYETLVSKPDMVVTTVDTDVPKNRADVVYQAKQNAAQVGKFDPKTGSVSVYVDDIGVDVVLGRDGLKHSLDRRLSVNAPVVLKAGEILSKSIRINEITPQKEEASESYVLIGTAKNEIGELYIVRSVINRFSNELASIDVLYAINAKKESAALLPLFTENSALGTDSTISIAELLDLVNQYFPDVLPEDVLKHYGHDARPDGDLGTDVLYSGHETDADVFNPEGKTLDEQLDDILKSAESFDGRYLYIGRITPTFINMLKEYIDIKDLPVVMNYRDAYLSMESKENGRYQGDGINYHNLGKEGMKRAIEAIGRPEQVMLSKKSGKIELVLECVDYKGDKFLSIIALNASARNAKKFIEAHIVTSIYGRRSMDKYVAKAEREGRLIYNKKEETVQGISQVQYEGNINTGSSKTNISRESKEVKSGHETDLEGYKTNGFKDYDIVSAVYTIRNEKAKRGHDLVEIGNMPTLYRNLFGLNGEVYVSNEHLYQNMVSRATAEAEGRFKADASADYHDLGEAKIINAIEQFQDPLVIMESLKDFKEPRLVAILDEKGNDGEHLIAVLELYAPLRPHGVSQLRNHVLITIYEKNSLPDYIEETVDKDRILYKKEGSHLTSQAGLRLAGEMSKETLKKNVARFNKKVKAFKEDNKIYYSTQETDLDSNRDLLANAFEGIAQDSKEYELIQEYKGRIKILNEYEEKLAELNAEIRKLTFETEGKRDMQKLKELQEKAKKVAEDINRNDKKLLSLEASEPLRKVIEQERKKATQKTKDHVKKIHQNKKIRAEQTELRHKIRKTIHDLDKLLNHGNKKLNVKEDMQGFVSKALQAAEILFTDNYGSYDMLRNGIGVELNDAEESLVATCTQMLQELDEMPSGDYDGWQVRQRAEEKLKNKMSKLKDVFVRERKRLNKTTVSSILGELVDAYSAMEDSRQDYVKGVYSEAVHNFLVNLRKEVGGTIVKDMSKEQLESVYSAYKMVLTTVKKANELFTKSKYESVEQITKKIVGDLNGRKKPKGKVATIARNLANQTGWSYEKLYYALDRIGSEAFTELVMNIANSENTVLQDVIEATAFRDEAAEKYGYNDWAVDKKIDRTFTDNTGKEFRLTLGELMSLYAYSRREGAWQHIEYGGFVFGKKTLSETNHADAYKLTREQCEAITGLLTKEQKAYVRAMQKFLSETMGAKGNEVSMQLYGVELFKEENYFPIHIAEQYRENVQESQAKEAIGLSSMANAGFTRAQNPNAKAPFVMEGFMAVWADHVNEMSRYHGTVPALEDFRKVMNRSTYFDPQAESMSVQAALENAFGKKAVEYFNDLYKEANSGAIREKLEKRSHKLLSLFRKNSVAYNLSVVIQQPSAMVRAYAMIDRKYFGVKGFGALTSGIAKAVSNKWTKAHTNAYNEMLKYAPGVTMAKEIGGFDTATGASIRSYLLDTKKSFRQKMRTESAVGKGKAVLDLVDNNAIANLPNLADKIAWIEIWEACKREVMTKQGHLFFKDQDVRRLERTLSHQRYASQETDVDRRSEANPDGLKEEPVYVLHRPGQDIQDFDHDLWTQKKAEAKQAYGLDDVESDSVDNYVAGKAYEWNAVLRGDLGYERTEFIDFWIQQAIDALSKFPRFAGRTYRNLSFADQNSFKLFLLKHQAGMDADVGYFASSSKDPNGYVVSGDYVVHMVMDGFGGKDISDSFSILGQEEVVYLPGTKLHITEVKTANDGHPLIYAQEVMENGKNLETNYGGSGQSASRTNNERQAGNAEGEGNDIRRVRNNRGMEGNSEDRNAKIQRSWNSSRYGQVKGTPNLGQQGQDRSFLTEQEEAFLTAVGKRFTEVIRATQVYDSIFAKSPVLRSKSMFVQMLASFMNEPNTAANMAEKAVRDVLRGDVKGSVRTAAVVIHSIVFNNLMTAIIYAMRDDDEDETYIEKYAETFVSSLMDDFNPFNYIPIARDVSSLAQGYRVERTDMSIIADVLAAVENVYKTHVTETEDMTDEQIVELSRKQSEATWGLVESLAAFAGIPMKNVRREINAIMDTAKSPNTFGGFSWPGLRNSVYDAVIDSIPFMSSEKSKTDKLYDAIVSGDVAYQNRLKATYKDVDAYENAVVKALRENDPRIHAAAQAGYEGNSEERNRIFREIKGEGKVDSALIIDAINSELNSIRNKAEPEKVTGEYAASDFIEAVSAGEAEKVQAARDDIISTYAANGMTQAEAEKAFVADVKTSARKAYAYELLTDAETENVLIWYAGMDKEDAAAMIEYWAFCNENPECADLSQSQVEKFYEFAEPADISLEVYAQFINGKKGLTDIKDKWGDVRVTKREQVLEVIDSLPLTWQQKDALYLAAGYSESKMWDVPW